MGEPNSVMGDILQLVVLSGTKEHGNKHVPVLRPEAVKHLIVTDNVTFTGLTTLLLFDYQIPKGKCLVVTYVSMAVSFLNGSDDAVSWDMGVSALASWKQLVNGEVQPLMTNSYLLGLINSPCFFVFPSEVTPQLAIAGTGATSADILLQARLNAYLVDSAYFELFNRYQSLVVRS